jgi:hypothetical protein
MYKMTDSECAYVGADVLTIQLAAGLVERNGIAMSTSQSFGTAVSDVQTSTGTGSWPRGASGMGTTVSTVDVKRIQTAVRVRPLADAHVPGSPPRGAPV